MSEDFNPAVGGVSAAGLSSGASVYFTAWAAGFSIPCLVMTLDQRLVWANRSALALIERIDEFSLPNGVFACADKAQAQEFRTFITTVKEQDAWLYELADGRHIIFRGEAVRPEGHPPGVGLMLIEAQSDERFMWADLIKAYGLTRSEALIARRMVSGAGAVDIAASLGVSIETVRTHIRRLYAKLSINSREKLFDAISRFRIS